ncbi:hypothetical protein DFH28DRAFT_858227, partial [Melampsora americana]
KELEAYQEDEIEFINQSNDVVLYIENHTADSSEEEKCEDNIIETLWPVFHTKWASEPVLGKRTAPNGQSLKGYKRPALNPDTTSKKLIPNLVPRSTKSDCTKVHDTAIGKNNKMMSNWLISSKTLPNSSADPKTTSPDHIQLDEPQSNAQDQWINEKVTAYQNKSHLPKVNCDTQLKLQTEKEWEELNQAIDYITQKHKRQQLDNPKFKYPHLIIDKLQEFNNRRKKLTLAKASTPSITASILMAQSTGR